MASLQDQLLQSGLVDKKKAKQLKQEHRKAAKGRQKGQVQIDETREQARRAQLEAERSRLDVEREELEARAAAHLARGTIVR